jgi:hypothetical protein
MQALTPILYFQMYTNTKPNPRDLGSGEVFSDSIAEFCGAFFAFVFGPKIAGGKFYLFCIEDRYWLP